MSLLFQPIVNDEETVFMSVIHKKAVLPGEAEKQGASDLIRGGMHQKRNLKNLS